MSSSTSLTMPVRLPRLREDQSRIVCHPAHVKVVAMGRRWGKTFMAGTYAVASADLGAAVAWVAPTYRNARTLWRFTERVLGPMKALVQSNKVEMEMTFPSGGRLGIYSADQDVGLRGEAFDVVIVDEAARVRSETYYDTIMPTLADRGGHCMLISTPMGRNWFWQEWMRGMSGEDSETISFRAPSSDNPNPRIKAAAARAKETMPERAYRQEWLAEFLEDGSGVFSRVSEQAVLQRGERNELHGYTAGVDWGRSSDWTVMTVVNATMGHQVDMIRFQGMGYEQQKERVRELFWRWKPYVIMAEANSMGAPLIEQMRSEGLPIEPFWTSGKSKMVLMDTLALGIEQQNLWLLDDHILVGEMEAYEATQTVGGVLRYSAPRGGHDDCVMALALAWSAAASPPAAGVSEEREEESVPIQVGRFGRRTLTVRRYSVGGR